MQILRPTNRSMPNENDEIKSLRNLEEGLEKRLETEREKTSSKHSKCKMN